MEGQVEMFPCRNCLPQVLLKIQYIVNFSPMTPLLFYDDLAKLNGSFILCSRRNDSLEKDLTLKFSLGAC